MLLPAGVEEAVFKRTENGWIFSSPNPWTFGRRRCYRINDAQKAALASRVRRGRYFRMLALVPMIVLLLAVFLHFPSLLRAPGFAACVVLGLFIVIFTMGLNLCDYFAVRPSLRGLERTTKRVSLVEMQLTQSRSMSVKALTVLALLEALGCGILIADWFALSSPNLYMLVGAVGMGLMAVLFLLMLVAKLKMQGATR